LLFGEIVVWAIGATAEDLRSGGLRELLEGERRDEVGGRMRRLSLK
jgi:hypothetical protein